LRLARMLPWTIWTLVTLVTLDVLVLRVIGADDLTGPLVVVNLLGFILALVLDAERIRRRPFEFEAFAPWTPDEVLDHADDWYDGRHWELEESPDDRVVVSREPELNRSVLALLLVAGIVPGLIYYAVSRRQRTVTITVAPEAREGGSLVRLSGTGLSSEALAFFRDLHSRGASRPGA
jgi:hypothetical protein